MNTDGTLSSARATTIDAGADKVPRNISRVIGLLLIAAFVMILNETIMSVALVTLMVEFSVSAATAQWLTTGFLLTMAVVIPTTGFILERFSTRSVFIASMSLFIIGTAVAAGAPAFSMLIAARVLQAGGTAVMLPLLITTVLTFVPARRRGRTMGLISIVIAVAPAIGPTFSGFILSVLSWRWMFLSILPVAAISLVLGITMIRNITTPKDVKFDAFSAVLSAIAFGGLIYGLSSIGESVQSATATPPLVPIVLGLVAMLLFVMRQIKRQRTNSALLDLRPFRNREFVVGIVVLLISMAAMFGTFILLPLYLQNVLELTTLQTGLILMPGALAMGLVAPLVGRMFDARGPRPLVIPGAIAVATALALMALLGESSQVAFVVGAHMLLSVGLGFITTPLMTSSLGSLRPELYPHGSAILNTLQQLAGAAGTAVFITIMATGTAASLARNSSALEASAAGIHQAFLWGAGLAIIGVLVSFLVKGQHKPEPKERINVAIP